MAQRSWQSAQPNAGFDSEKHHAVFRVHTIGPNPEQIQQRCRRHRKGHTRLLSPPPHHLLPGALLPRRHLVGDAHVPPAARSHRRPLPPNEERVHKVGAAAEAHALRQSIAHLLALQRVPDRCEHNQSLQGAGEVRWRQRAAYRQELDVLFSRQHRRSLAEFET